MFTILLFALLLLNNTVFGLSCKPAGPAGILMSVSFSGNHTEVYEVSDTKKVNGHPALVKAKETEQVFQFYECNAPTSKYKTGGQIRSVLNDSMCITPGAVYRFNTGIQNFTKYPEHADDRISLQPCAQVHSLTMRLQWFMGTETENSCAWQISQQGWKTDLASDEVVLSENGVALDVRERSKKKSLIYIATKHGHSHCRPHE